LGLSGLTSRYGPGVVTTVAVGNNISQRPDNSTLENDFEALAKALSSLGVDDILINKLKVAVNEDAAENGGVHKIGKKITEWLGLMNLVIPVAEIGFKIPQIIQNIKQFIGS